MIRIAVEGFLLGKTNNLERLEPPSAPHYTQVPDDFFDRIVQHLGNAEVRVYLFLMRKTFGWKKTGDSIAMSQISDGTGLARKNVWPAIQALEARGLIEVIRSQAENGSPATNYYRLIVAK